LIWIFIALFGLVIGSFINVLIARIPKGESVIFPESHCPKCDTKLKPWHNIPLLSYLFLGRKCAYCKTPISIQYPLVEFSSAVIFVTIFAKVGMNIDALLLSLVFVILLALSIIDLYYKAVPDSLNLSALTLAIFSGSILESFEYALLFAGAFSLLRFYISFIIGKEAMGEGDIMIAATIGAILGFKLSLVTIFLSALLSLPVSILMRSKTKEIPYIPFLSLALLIVYLFDEYFNNILENLYG